MDDSVYIAGPFFNETQLEFIKSIECVCIEREISYFSPRTYGVLIDLTPEERIAATKDIYDMNIKKIKDCNVMVAVIDDFDTGTVFEMGYATSLKHLFPSRRVISITNNNYGMNVMLRESVDAHLRGLENLGDCLALATKRLLVGDKFMADRGETW